MSTDVALEALEQAIRQLPASRRQEVLLFIQFLEYRDEAEDAHLWKAVEQYQVYRATHTEEQPDIYESGEAFLRAEDAPPINDYWLSVAAMREDWDAMHDD
jgi:hypothetical protein